MYSDKELEVMLKALQHYFYRNYLIITEEEAEVIRKVVNKLKGMEQWKR